MLKQGKRPVRRHALAALLIILAGGLVWLTVKPRLTRGFNLTGVEPDLDLRSAKNALESLNADVSEIRHMIDDLQRRVDLLANSYAVLGSAARTPSEKQVDLEPIESGGAAIEEVVRRVIEEREYEGLVRLSKSAAVNYMNQYRLAGTPESLCQILAQIKEKVGSLQSRFGAQLFVADEQEEEYNAAKVALQQWAIVELTKDYDLAVALDIFNTWVGYSDLNCSDDDARAILAK